MQSPLALFGDAGDLWLQESPEQLLHTVKTNIHSMLSAKEHQSQSILGNSDQMKGVGDKCMLKELPMSSASPAAPGVSRLTSIRDMYQTTCKMLPDGQSSTTKRLSEAAGLGESPALSRHAKRKIVPPSPKVSDWSGSPAVRLSESTLALSSPGDIGASASKRRKLAEDTDPSSALASVMFSSPLKAAFDAVADPMKKENIFPKNEASNAGTSTPKRRMRRMGIISQVTQAPKSTSPAQDIMKTPPKAIQQVPVEAPSTIQRASLRFSSSVKPSHYADREAAAAPPKRNRAERMSLLPQPGFMSRGLPTPFPINSEPVVPEKPSAPAPATVAKSQNTSARVTRFSSRQAQQKQAEQVAKPPASAAAPLPVAPASTSIAAPSPIRTLRSRVIPKRTIEPPKAAVPPTAPPRAEELPKSTAPATARKETTTTRRVVQSQTLRKTSCAVPRMAAASESNQSTPPKTTRASSITSTVKKVPRTQLKPELRKARIELRPEEPSFETAESFKLFEKQLEEAMRLGVASVGNIGASIRKTVEETVPEKTPSILEDDEQTHLQNKKRK